MPVRSVCVFCGASIGANPAYREAAIALGQAIARRGLTLVYGGGAVGLMGVVADAAMAAGGEVVGIIPQSLLDAEVGHKGLTRLEVVDGMHARKARMAELADGFIAVPGGIGTLEELMEVWTSRSLGMHVKPVVVLDPFGDFAGLRELVGTLGERGFVRPTAAAHLQWATEVGEALDLVQRGVAAAAEALAPSSVAGGGPGSRSADPAVRPGGPPVRDTMAG